MITLYPSIQCLLSLPSEDIQERNGVSCDQCMGAAPFTSPASLTLTANLTPTAPLASAASGRKYLIIKHLDHN